MVGQTAIFTYGQSRNQHILRERLANFTTRLGIFLASLVIFVINPCYCILYLLYMVLTMPAIELAIDASGKIGILKPTMIPTKRFRLARFACHLAFPAMIVFAGAYNNYHPQILQAAVELPRKSSSIKELKIVFAADIHLDPVHVDPGNDRFLERFVAKANSLEADLILLGGDILDCYFAINKNAERKNLANLKNQFRRLHARYGVYAIPGNHDHIDEVYADFFAASGIKLLRDSVEKVGNAFYLAGYEDESKPIEELLKPAQDDLPIILLKHIPSDLDSISQSRVDMQLSGHTHNGHVFPANLLVMPIEWELAHGIKIKRNTLFAVTSGMHYSDFPVNTASLSEIVYIKAVFRPDIKRPRMSGIWSGFTPKLFARD